MGQTVCFWPLEAVQLGYNPTHIGCNAAWTPAGLQTFVGVFRGIIDSGGESFSLEKAGNAEKDGASGGIRTHDLKMAHLLEALRQLWHEWIVQMGLVDGSLKRCTANPL